MGTSKNPLPARCEARFVPASIGTSGLSGSTKSASLPAKRRLSTAQGRRHFTKARMEPVGHTGFNWLFVAVGRHSQLDDSDIGTAIEQMSCKAVPERVQRPGLLDSGRGASWNRRLNWRGAHQPLLDSKWCIAVWTRNEINGVTVLGQFLSSGLFGDALRSLLAWCDKSQLA
jgi:hypothetical protein